MCDRDLKANESEHEFVDLLAMKLNISEDTKKV